MYWSVYIYIMFASTVMHVCYVFYVIDGFVLMVELSQFRFNLMIVLPHRH